MIISGLKDSDRAGIVCEKKGWKNLQKRPFLIITALTIIIMIAGVKIVDQVSEPKITRGNLKKVEEMEVSELEEIAAKIITEQEAYDTIRELHGFYSMRSSDWPEAFTFSVIRLSSRHVRMRWHDGQKVIFYSQDYVDENTSMGFTHGGELIGEVEIKAIGQTVDLYEDLECIIAPAYIVSFTYGNSFYHFFATVEYEEYIKAIENLYLY